MTQVCKVGVLTPIFPHCFTFCSNWWERIVVVFKTLIIVIVNQCMFHGLHDVLSLSSCQSYEVDLFGFPSYRGENWDLEKGCVSKVHILNHLGGILPPPPQLPTNHVGFILWIHTKAKITEIKEHTWLPASAACWIPAPGGQCRYLLLSVWGLLPVNFPIFQAVGRATTSCSKTCLNLIPPTKRQLCLSIERLWKIVLCFIRHSRQD